MDEQAREDLIEKIVAIFTNEADAAEFDEDPEGYVDEHLPEGVDGEDVASCLPQVGERTGLDFSNVASTGGGTAAGQLSHTYQTIYQQNTYIYAGAGSQVTNVQGDGNAVAQQDVDVDVDYGDGDGDDTEQQPVEATPEAPEGEHAPDPRVTTTPEDLWGDDAPEEPLDEGGWEPQVDLVLENSAHVGGEAPSEAPEPTDAPDPMDDLDL